MEQSVKVLLDQQTSEVTRFAEMEVLRILKNDALARLERRKARLEKLEVSSRLAGQHGHVHVDLLYLLMEMQHRCLNEVAEFIADARHFIATEYKLSSTRCVSTFVFHWFRNLYIFIISNFCNSYFYNLSFLHNLYLYNL